MPCQVLVRQLGPGHDLLAGHVVHGQRESISGIGNRSGVNISVIAPGELAGESRGAGEVLILFMV
jgi:hypothetical protein